MSALGESACTERGQYSMELKEDGCVPLLTPPFPHFSVKVSKNLSPRVVDFRRDATLFVAPRPSLYPDNLYAE